MKIFCGCLYTKIFINHHRSQAIVIADQQPIFNFPKFPKKHFLSRNNKKKTWNAAIEMQNSSSRSIIFFHAFNSKVKLLIYYYITAHIMVPRGSILLCATNTHLAISNHKLRSSTISTISRLIHDSLAPTRRLHPVEWRRLVLEAFPKFK